jgi:hypothetical protein
MTLHSKLSQRRSVSCRAWRLSVNFDHHLDYRLKCFRPDVAAGLVDLHCASVAGDLESRRCLSCSKHFQDFILPCGIGGDFADLGLEFGVDLGDCVW